MRCARVRMVNNVRNEENYGNNERAYHEDFMRDDFFLTHEIKSRKKQKPRTCIQTGIHGWQNGVIHELFPISFPMSLRRSFMSFSSVPL